ncbi:hypothetical protein GEU84_005330 [Fertoebacter nigrum]|uniref:Ribbon-helix-helix protein, CopG family n=1 Tax=Fertoeibacter niger TaxID=2656921 RepID=A0A8X8H085_9RHOB|nr:hypothetical protein [Fertoeibacter niger]
MKKSRLTVRNVDPDAIEGIRKIMREHRISLGDLVSAALMEHIQMLESLGYVSPGGDDPRV